MRILYKVEHRRGSTTTIASANLPMVYGQDNSVFSQETVLLTKSEYIQLKWEANYWKSQHARTLEREAALKKEVEYWKAQVRDLKQRLYGKKSEKSSTITTEQKPKTSRKRGHQRGAAGHGRTDRSHLPLVEEERDLEAEEKCCSICGKPFSSLSQDGGFGDRRGVGSPLYSQDPTSSIQQGL